MMCLLLSRRLSKVGTGGIHRARRVSATNHEINLSKTYTARNPYKRASPSPLLTESAVASSLCASCRSSGEDENAFLLFV
jgi:hypothetical protein